MFQFFSNQEISQYSENDNAHLIYLLFILIIFFYKRHYSLGSFYIRVDMTRLFISKRA